MVISRSKPISHFVLGFSLLLHPVRGVTPSPGESLAPDDQQVVNFAIQQDIWSLEPDQATNFWQRYILDMVLEPLVRFGSAHQIVPAAATHWEPNADKTVWRFYLRKSGRWSNGDPVTAHDFVRTYHHYCDPEIRTKLSLMFRIDTFPLKNVAQVFSQALPMDALGVKALDEWTLALTFERPMEEKLLLNLLTQPRLAPIHPRFLDAIRHQQPPSRTYLVRHYDPQGNFDGQYLKDDLKPEEREAFPGNPFISNGPFTIVELKFGTVVKAEKNPYYWDAKNVALQKVNWKFTRLTPRDFWKVAVEENGWNIASMHGVPACPRDLRADVWDRWGTAYTVPSTETTQLFILNTRCQKLKDENVRKALDILLNREAVVAALLEHSAISLQPDPKQIVSYTLIPPTSQYTSGYRPDFSDWDEPKRIQAGEALLRAAGYSAQNPLTLSLSISDGEHGAHACFQALGSKLFPSSLVHLNLKIVSQDPTDLLEPTAFEILFRGYIFWGEIPEALLKGCKTSGLLGRCAGLQTTNWDQRLDAATRPNGESVASSETDRYARLRGLECQLMAQHALLSVSHLKETFVIEKSVRGFSHMEHPLGYPDLRFVYRVNETPKLSQAQRSEASDLFWIFLDDPMQILFSFYGARLGGWLAPIPLACERSTNL